MFTISYIIVTKNRLTFLKMLLDRLLPQLNSDEEVVVVDGDSSDGTKEYLAELLKQNKIHQFVSEPDRNQAHGWNKALLMAKGEIIKKLIDDDVFCYKAIRCCANYMLKNPKVDIVISNDLGCSLADYQNIAAFSRLKQFEKWRSGLNPSFTFGDVHLLIRRSSLSYIGLYNSAYILLDWEFSLRASYLKADIAYYTGYNALSVTHPQSVSSLKNIRLVDVQSKRAEIFYEYAGDKSDISHWSKFKISTGKMLNYNKARRAGGNIDYEAEHDIGKVYDFLYDHITRVNHSENFNFL